MWRPARRATWPQGGTFHRAKALALRGTKGDSHNSRVTGRHVTGFPGYCNVAHIIVFAVIYYKNPKPKEKKKRLQASATFLKLPARNDTQEKDLKPLP